MTLFAIDPSPLISWSMLCALLEMLSSRDASGIVLAGRLLLGSARSSSSIRPKLLSVRCEALSIVLCGGFGTLSSLNTDCGALLSTFRCSSLRPGVLSCLTTLTAACCATVLSFRCSSLRRGVLSCLGALTASCATTLFSSCSSLRRGVLSCLLTLTAGCATMSSLRRGVLSCLGILTTGCSTVLFCWTS
eukprot:PhF_6_TR37795/c0_g1_i2/m.56267